MLMQCHNNNNKINQNTQLSDKFKIIENPIENLTKDEVNSDIDNYIENLLLSDEKIIHADFISAISFFHKDIDYTKIINKHLENYLKQKRLAIRNSIKKGNFDFDTLIKIIENFSEKIIKMYNISSDELTKKNSYLQLFEQIISENSLIGFLKSELAIINDNNTKSLSILIKKMKEITNFNPETKSYQWLLFLISSSLASTVEENFEKTYPVPENYQKIMNISLNAEFCKKIYDYYTLTMSIIDINVILSSSVNLLMQQIKYIFDNCSLNIINKILKDNYYIFNIIVNKIDFIFDGKSIKELMTNKFFTIIDKKTKDFSSSNLEALKEFTETFQIFEKIINNSGTMREIINNKISLIFSSESTQDFLIELIHQNIIGTKENALDILSNDILSNILGFCSNIKEKDKFIDKYNKYLITRMLNEPLINIEKIYLQNLIEKFGDKLLLKTSKIIIDTENTLKDMNNFKNILLDKSYQHLKKLNVITSSYNNWDINQTEGIINLETRGTNLEKDNISLLTKHLLCYQEFYEARYSNKRKLNWYPHFGEITFDYLEKEIKMLPIQFLIIEYVSQNKCDKEKIINANFLVNYNKDFKQSLISSLIFGGILKLNGDDVTLVDNSELISSDFINIFFTTTNYGNIWEQKRKEELIMNRQDVISAQINHFVKQKPMLKDELFKTILLNIKIFELDIDLFNKTIDKMIENDYIKLEDNMVVKLLW
jgi:hypothetical protein